MTLLLLPTSRLHVLCPLDCELSSFQPGSRLPCLGWAPFTSTHGTQPSASGACLPLAPTPSVSLPVSVCLSVSLSLCLCLSLSLSLSVCLSSLSFCLSLSVSLSLWVSSSSHHLCPSLCVPISVCLPLYLSLSLLTGHSYVFLMFYFRITKSHPTKSQINV